MGSTDHLMETEEEYLNWYLSELPPADAEWHRAELERVGPERDEHGVVGDGLDIVRGLRDWAIALSWPGLAIDESASVVHDLVTELLRNPKVLHDVVGMMSFSAFEDFQIERELGPGDAAEPPEPERVRMLVKMRTHGQPDLVVLRTTVANKFVAVLSDLGFLAADLPSGHHVMGVGKDGHNYEAWVY